MLVSKMAWILVMVRVCASLARLWCLVVWSNISLDVAKKVYVAGNAAAVARRLGGRSPPPPMPDDTSAVRDLVP